MECRAARDAFASPCASGYLAITARSASGAPVCVCVCVYVSRVCVLQSIAEYSEAGGERNREETGGRREEREGGG